MNATRNLFRVARRLIVFASRDADGGATLAVSPRVDLCALKDFGREATGVSSSYLPMHYANSPPPPLWAWRF